MSRKCLSAAVILVLLTLIPSSVYAYPSVGRVAPEGFFASIWSRFATFLAADRPNGQGDKPKAGSSMDPNGTPLASAGSQMDPNGVPVTDTSGR